MLVIAPPVARISFCEEHFVKLPSSLASGVLLAIVLPLFADAKPVVTLKLTGSYVTKSSGGHVVLIALDKVSPKPGDEIEWDIAATNGGTSPALKFIPKAAIPNGTVFVAGSVKMPNGHPEFSLDGGKTWSASPTVAMKQPDGGVKNVKADPSLYTAVRFVGDAPLAARDEARYSYDVRVK
jgi:uncharacterized repeat protein (TIGR01451 family)